MVAENSNLNMLEVKPVIGDIAPATALRPTNIDSPSVLLRALEEGAGLLYDEGGHRDKDSTLESASTFIPHIYRGEKKMRARARKHRAASSGASTKNPGKKSKNVPSLKISNTNSNVRYICGRSSEGGIDFSQLDEESQKALELKESESPTKIKVAITDICVQCPPNLVVKVAREFRGGL